MRGSVAARLLIVTAVISETLYLVLSYFIAGHLSESIENAHWPADVPLSSWATATRDPAGDPVFWIWFGVSVSVSTLSWWDTTHPNEPSASDPISVGLACFGGVATLALAPINTEMAALALVYTIACALTMYLPRKVLAPWHDARLARASTARQARSW